MTGGYGRAMMQVMTEVTIMPEGGAGGMGGG
jgi:hypothetical protein